jgi:hypothetical protein
MRVLFALLFTISTAQAACELSFPQSNLCADLTWTQGPVVNQASALQLKFDRAFAPYKFKLDVWMTSMGHGSRPVVMRSVDDVTLGVTQIWFTMRGPWLVRGFLLNDAGSVVEKAEMEIRL